MVSSAAVTGSGGECRAGCGAQGGKRSDAGNVDCSMRGSKQGEHSLHWRWLCCALHLMAKAGSCAEQKQCDLSMAVCEQAGQAVI